MYPTATTYQEIVLVFPVQESGPLPTACDPEGTYPYPTFSETSDRPVLQELHFIQLENKHLIAVVCPDTGGRLVSLKIKTPHGPAKETLFDSGVIRPVRILPRGAFIGGGIELSFPISHTPSLLEKIHCEHGVEDTSEGTRAYVRFGERELRFGMQWTGEYSLGEDDDFITQRAEFHNPGQHPHPWMSWSNAGVPCAPDTQFDFPRGPVLCHCDTLGEIDWETDGPQTQSDITTMSGYFWKNPDINAFGIFTPSLGIGLYHLADRQQMPGIKLWSDGVGQHEGWVNQYTTDQRQCLEIQAGPLIDQGIKAVLVPGETHRQTEYWFPTTQRIALQDLKLPAEPTTPLPRFSWARPHAVGLFLQLIEAWKLDAPENIPPAPDITSNLWAPSGMDDLGDALRWAIAQSRDDSHLKSKAGVASSICAATEADRWKFQLGAWLAALDHIDEALETLMDSADPRSPAFAGVLFLNVKNDPASSVIEFERINHSAIRHHPQVVVAFDHALRQVGSPDSLSKRRELHNHLVALTDDDLVESRARLLLDEGNAQQALDLMTSQPWTLVHQHYSRTKLLQSIHQSLGTDSFAQPELVGEDNLAEFGAYQEY